jgi:hypothetical protein
VWNGSWVEKEEKKKEQQQGREKIREGWAALLYHRHLEMAGRSKLQMENQTNAMTWASFEC